MCMCTHTPREETKTTTKLQDLNILYVLFLLIVLIFGSNSVHFEAEAFCNVLTIWSHYRVRSSIHLVTVMFATK